MSHLLEVIARAERALATNARKGISRDGFHSLVSLSAADLQTLVDAAAITAAAAQAQEPAS